MEMLLTSRCFPHGMVDPSSWLNLNAVNVLHALSEKVNQRGPGVIKMILGKPNEERPPFIVEAEQRALANPTLQGYTTNQGYIPLRQQIAKDMARWWGVEYDWQTEILITHGAKEALALAGLVVAGPKKSKNVFREGFPPTILTFEPSWSGYNGISTISDAVVEPIGSGGLGEMKTQDLEERIDQVRRMSHDMSNDKSVGHISAFLINSPNNPTGAMISNEDQDRLVALAKDLDIPIIDDAVYHRYVFDNAPYRPFVNVKGAKNHVIYINSASKSYKMTGSRVGWICAPEKWIKPASLIHSHITTCNDPAPQEAVRAVLEEEAREAVFLGNPIPATTTYPWVRHYEQKRNRFFAELSELPGFRDRVQIKPQGTFFAWVNISAFGMPSKVYCEKMLEEYNIGIAPGIVFGPHCDGFARYSLTVSDEDLEKALEGHRTFAEKYAKNMQ